MKNYHPLIPFCKCFRLPGFNYWIKIQGPAINVKFDTFDCDLTYSLKCNNWTENISNWPYRVGKKWPCEVDVKRITSEDFHVVPKSQEDDREGLSWRISFSKAEISLSHLIPTMAYMAFLGIKVVTKNVLSVASKKLKSYHIKTLLFYILERTGESFWLSQTHSSGFYYLLSNLEDAICTKSCPHFFLPEVNLFQVLTSGDQRKLLAAIRRIKSCPERFIEDLPDSVLIHGVYPKSDEVTLLHCAKSCLYNFGQ